MIVEKTLSGVGLMSGSSLDGLDVAYSQYKLRYNSEEKVLLSLEHELMSSACYTFPKELSSKMREPDQLSIGELMKLDVSLGVFFADCVLRFLESSNLPKPDYIASHGHTVLHRPEDGFSLQIGSAAHIASVSGINTIADFRSSDLAHGGQGAPMAPLVDRLLFKDVDLFLNIGGIANISFQKEGASFGYDIAPANQFLNRLAEQKGMEYDEGGQMAAKGQINTSLLDELLAVPFFSSSSPKSLDNVYLREELWPIVDGFSISIEDKLATCVELIVITFRKALHHFKDLKSVKNQSLPVRLLVSGGGAKNDFLMQRLLQADSSIRLELMDIEESVIDMKEAILMSLAGALRVVEIPNLLSSVTGAESNSTGGAIYLSF